MNWLKEKLIGVAIISFVVLISYTGFQIINKEQIKIISENSNFSPDNFSEQQKKLFDEFRNKEISEFRNESGETVYRVKLSDGSTEILTTKPLWTSDQYKLTQSEKQRILDLTKIEPPNWMPRGTEITLGEYNVLAGALLALGFIIGPLASLFDLMFNRTISFMSGVYGGLVVFFFSFLAIGIEYISIKHMIYTPIIIGTTGTILGVIGAVGLEKIIRSEDVAPKASTLTSPQT